MTDNLPHFKYKLLIYKHTSLLLNGRKEDVCNGPFGPFIWISCHCEVTHKNKNTIFWHLLRKQNWGLYIYIYVCVCVCMNINQHSVDTGTIVGYKMALIAEFWGTSLKFCPFVVKVSFILLFWIKQWCT
jgi:hypothetical protein